MKTVKRRRLGDLYVRGRELNPSDGEGEAVTVWLSKLNSVDRDAVVRRASAAKARFLIDATNEDSEDFAAAYGETLKLSDRSELITFLIADDAEKARRRVDAELIHDEETWGKDDYLQGLVDSWYGDDDNPGLIKTIEEDADDPEALRVRAELDRFGQESVDGLRAEVERLTKDWADVDLETVRRKAAHQLLKMRADEEFLKEFRRQQLFYAVREPNDHHKRYFGTVAEVDDLDEDLRGYLNEQYESLIVGAEEGKDWPAPADSSNSSAQPDPVETSGLEDASA